MLSRKCKLFKEFAAMLRAGGSKSGPGRYAPLIEAKIVQ
jgi:hypothetical protein